MESLVITPQKCKRSASKIAEPGTSQFSNTPADFSTAFENFSEKFSQYFLLFPQKRVDPKVMVQFKILSKSFDIMNKNYSRIFRKKPAPNPNMIPYYTSFTSDWFEFLTMYIEIANMGIAPQITEVNFSFDSLYNSLADLRSLITEEKFRTDIGCKAILAVQNSINAIRKIVQRLFIKKEGEESDDGLEYNQKAFTYIMKKLNSDISYMFMRSLTHQCLKKSDKIRINSDMNTACLSIHDNVAAANKLHEYEIEARASIKRLNEMAKQIFASLEIPFGIEIDFKNDRKNEMAKLLELE
jgi:hypothetical protein